MEKLTKCVISGEETAAIRGVIEKRRLPDFDGQMQIDGRKTDESNLYANLHRNKQRKSLRKNIDFRRLLKFIIFIYKDYSVKERKNIHKWSTLWS